MNITQELRDFDDPYFNRIADRLEQSGALVPLAQLLEKNTE